MIKRTSLVWKHPSLSDARFRELWLGEHLTQAKRLPGLREYVIDFVQEGPQGAPAGIATLRFDDREALERAFQVPGLSEDLIATRALFAQSVQVCLVDERVVVPRTTGGA